MNIVNTNIFVIKGVSIFFFIFIFQYFLIPGYFIFDLVDFFRIHFLINRQTFFIFLQSQLSFDLSIV